MAATKTVPQLPETHNSLTPRLGVVTLFGYGIQVRVDRGHLLVEDGIGEDRRKIRLARVNHGLKRLVCIGADGAISLAALQWLAAQDASEGRERGTRLGRKRVDAGVVTLRIVRCG